MAHAIGMTLFTACTIDLARSPDRGAWTRLFVTATAVAGCGASAVLLLGLLAPLVSVAAVVAYSRELRKALRLVGLLVGSMVYPVGVAAWVLAASTNSLGSDSPVHGLYARAFGPNAGLVFGGSATIGVMIAAILLAPLGLARRDRLFVTIWAVGAAALLLNPLVAPWVIGHVTTPNLYWRAFYVAPVFLLVALAGAGVADRVARAGPGRAAWTLGAVLAALILLQIPAQQGGLYARSELVRPFPDPDRCLDRLVAGQARYLARAAPPGPMLAPPYLSRIVPLVGADHPQLMHQEESIRLWAADEFSLRHAASSCLAGKRPKDVASVAVLLRVHPELVAVAALAAAAADPRLEEVLLRAGLKPTPDSGLGVRLYVRE